MNVMPVLVLFTPLLVLFFIFSVILFCTGSLCHYWFSPWPWAAGAIGAWGSALFVATRTNVTVGFTALVIVSIAGLAGYEMARMDAATRPHYSEMVMAIFGGMLATAGLFGCLVQWG